jgi:hypothetical protein
MRPSGEKINVTLSALVSGAGGVARHESSATLLKAPLSAAAAGRLRRRSTHVRCGSTRARILEREMLNHIAASTRRDHVLERRGSFRLNAWARRARTPPGPRSVGVPPGGGLQHAILG